METEVANSKIGIESRGGEGVGVIGEVADARPEELEVGGMGAIDVENDARRGQIGEGCDGRRENYRKSGGTSALESPVEVWVLLGVGLDKLALGSDGFKLERVIGSCRRMSVQVAASQRKATHRSP